MELLQQHYQEAEGLKLVLARLLDPSLVEGEDERGTVIDRYKKLSSSLSLRLDTQNAETDHWRQECNR